MPYSVGEPLLLQVMLFKKQACRTIILYIQTAPSLIKTRIHCNAGAEASSRFKYPENYMD